MELRLAVVQPETLTGADAPKNVDRAVHVLRGVGARQGLGLDDGESQLHRRVLLGTRI